MSGPNPTTEFMQAMERIEDGNRFPVLDVLKAQGFKVETDPEQTDDAAPGEVVLWRLVATCPTCQRFFADAQGAAVACGLCRLKGIHSFGPTQLERVKVRVEP